MSTIEEIFGEPIFQYAVLVHVRKFGNGLRNGGRLFMPGAFIGTGAKKTVDT